MTYLDDFYNGKELSGIENQIRFFAQQSSASKVAEYWGQWEWMKRIFSFIIPRKNVVEKEEHRMKIVKDLFVDLNKIKQGLPNTKKGECNNFYYLDILTIEKFNEEVWLEYVDTLKACFTLMGAVKECEDI